MKNFIKRSIIFTWFIMISCSIFTSCDQDDFEPLIYDNINGQTLASFSTNSSDLAIIIDDVGSVDIEIAVTTISSSDRTINISIDEDNTTADSQNYMLPSTVIIPANNYFGTLTVSGVDNTVETTAESLVIKLDSVDGGIVSSATHTISVYQVCPVPETYMIGDYLLTDNGNGNFGIGVPVTISIPEDNNLSRTFVTTFLPGTGVARDVDVVINLICNLFELEEIDINVTCTQVTSYLITTAPVANSSSYDTGDDTSLVVNYLEDPESDCGPAQIQNFTLTKQ